MNKELVTVPSGNKVEVVYQNKKDKQLICLSTQLNCAVGCVFCASPNSKKTINLDVNDMLYQIHYMLDKYEVVDKPLLVSFMGEGEPLQNYKNVEEVIRSINKEDIKVAVSTSGIKPKNIVKLAKLEQELSIPIKLQVSLHASNDLDRAGIIPNLKI